MLIFGVHSGVSQVSSRALDHQITRDSQLDVIWFVISFMT